MAEHISVVTKAIASQAINKKIALLEKWLENGIPWKVDANGLAARDVQGEYILEYFPSNIAAFSAWDSSQNTCSSEDLKDIILTTRSTIYCSHGGDLSLIKDIFPKLVAIAARQQSEANKTYIIGKNQDELIYLRKLAAQQVDEIIQAALQSDEMRIDLLKANRSLANLRAHAEAETQQLRTRIAELTSTLKKLTPIRRGSN